MDSTKTLKFSENDKQITFKAPQNLLDLLNAHDISISQVCGGNGICTTCRVKVDKINGLENRNEIEIERAAERSFSDDERLACQSVLLDSIEIKIENSEIA